MSVRGRSTALSLIGQLLTVAGPGANLIEASEREWSSATFAGVRHIIILTVPVGTIDSLPPPWTATIGEHDFTLSRAFVADAIASAEPPSQDDCGGWVCRCTIELLTVDDDVS